MGGERERVTSKELEEQKPQKVVESRKCRPNSPGKMLYPEKI